MRYCEKNILKWKPQYTGYPAPMRKCSNPAKFMLNGVPTCTRHTPKELRIKENRIEAVMDASVAQLSASDSQGSGGDAVRLGVPVVSESRSILESPAICHVE